jgi:hypothetical protein
MSCRNSNVHGEIFVERGMGGVDSAAWLAAQINSIVDLGILCY